MIGFLTITEGCGINIAGTAISVDPVTLAGDGLDVQGDVCKLPKVSLDACTMKFTEEKSIAVDLANIAGAGLKANTEEAACELEVVPGLGIAPTAPNDDVGLYSTGHNDLSTVGQVYGHVLNTFQHFTVGCGLEIVAGVIRVKVADLNTGGDCALTFPSTGGGDIVSAGCGITITGVSPKEISVNIEALAGLGLGTETSGGVCQLRVKIGCGLTTDTIGDTIRINPVAIAGPGLGVGASNEADMDGPCELKVNVDLGLEIDGDDVQIHDTDYNGTGLQVYGHDTAAVFRHFTIGCGLEVVAGVLRVKATDLAGANLTPSGTCTLNATGDTVAPGCGIIITGTDPKVINVNPVDLAGNGLVPGGGLCDIAVNPGCNIEIVDDKVQVKLSALAGPGLGVDTSGDPAACALKVNYGCGLQLDTAQDTIRIKPSDIVGDGLQVALSGNEEDANGPCKIQAKLGCGLDFSSDGTPKSIIVKIADLIGDGLGQQTGNQADKDGPCKMKVVTNLTIKDPTSIELNLSGGTLEVKLNYRLVEVYGIVGASGEMSDTVSTTVC